MFPDERRIFINERKRKKKAILSRVKRKYISLKEASELLDLCYRQSLRLKKNFLENGDLAMPHKSRDKSSNIAKPKEFKKKVLVRHRESSWDFGPTLASEKLAKDRLIID